MNWKIEKFLFNLKNFQLFYFTWAEIIGIILFFILLINFMVK